MSAIPSAASRCIPFHWLKVLPTVPFSTVLGGPYAAEGEIVTLSFTPGYKLPDDPTALTVTDASGGTVMTKQVLSVCSAVWAPAAPSRI